MRALETASSICTAFLECAATSPDARMVHHRGKNWTYGQIERQSAALAGLLQASGVVAGDRVALLLHNSAQYVASYFAVLRMGGVVVALQPESTPRELVHTLLAAQPQGIIAEADCLDHLQALAQHLNPLRTLVICQNRPSAPESGALRWVGWNEACAHPVGTDCHPQASDAPAQIIFTSGTTGPPKGVVLSHGNLLANCRSIVQYLGLGPGDSMMVVLPFYYSYGNSLLFTHAAVGGQLVLASDFVFWNRVLELMKAERASGLAGVPTTFSILLNRSLFPAMGFPDLRYLTCAGGALAPAAVRRLRECVPHARLFVMYGQTEATARLSTLMPEDLDRKPGSIGRGIPGVTLSIRDAEGRTAPPGVEGEIFAQGPNIMLGYWNDPESTRNVLTPHGLRTGDMGRTDDEGYFYITGRGSEFIKRGGTRIHPREVEDVILELSGVAEAAAVGVFDEILQEAIVACVVLSERAKGPDAEFILNHCRAALPRTKWPSRVEIVGSLPKTASGKVKRNELKNLAAGNATQGG
jgi:acyl-CoA synthetase (AMP-forming)/AMP-acid ligase II